MFVFDFLKGITVYRLGLDNTEKFINSVKADVSIKNMSLEKDGILNISCFYREREKLETALHINGGTIINKRTFGIPVVAERLKHRLGLIAGLVISVCLIMLSSLFVWEIRIEGNEKLRDSEVVEMLKKAGLREGMMKKTVDVKKVTDRLLINEDAVSWMAINFDGTVAHVEMKEAKIALPAPKKENVNLVASTNGIILRVDALEGGTKVAKGDVVLKGQLLVSAFVDKRTGGSMLRGARGFVWANTVRSFGVVVPLEYKIKKYTGNTRHDYSFTFLGKTLSFSDSVNSGTEKSEFVKHHEKLRLFGKVVLPVTFNRAVHNEYTEFTQRRTKQQALLLARQTAKERLLEISPDFAIADFDEEYTVEDGKLIYKCNFDGVENIATELEFKLS